MSYIDFREEKWPFDQLWGEEDSENVKDYLKQIYMDNNVCRDVRNTRKNVEKEAEYILEWWWLRRYNAKETKASVHDYPQDFGKWILDRYRNTMSLNPIDNQAPAPRQ